MFLCHRETAESSVDVSLSVSVYVSVCVCVSMPVCMCLMQSPTGGRITVIQTQLPTVGAGALKSREEPDDRLGKV